MPDEEEFQEVDNSGSNAAWIGMLAALVGVLVGLAVMFFLGPGLGGGDSGEPGEGELRGAEGAENLPEEVSNRLRDQATSYVSLGDFEVNLADDHYLSATVELKVIDYETLHQLEEQHLSQGDQARLERDAVYAAAGGGGGGEGEGEEAAEPRTVQTINKKEPEMRSMVIDTFNATPSSELRDPDGKQRIKEKLKEKLNTMIREDHGKILEVLFSKLVVAAA